MNLLSLLGWEWPVPARSQDRVVEAAEDLRPRVWDGPPVQAYWAHRGWRHDGKRYRGHYRRPFGCWKGEAEARWSGFVDLFIQHPPEFLRRDSHWDCFSQCKNGWYSIHFNEPVREVSAGILGVEQILNEAFRRNRGNHS